MSSSFEVGMMRRIVACHDFRSDGFTIDRIATVIGIAAETVVRYLRLPRPIMRSVPDMSWTADAACRGTDVNYFYPNVNGAPAVALKERAKWMCQGCPVRLQCLEAAEANYERFGVWGGVDFSNRQYRFDKVTGEITVRVKRGTFQKVG